MKPISLLFVFCFLLFSCSEENKTQSNNFTPKITEAKAYVVPADSIGKSKVILIDERKLKKIICKDPVIVAANTNIFSAGIPKVLIAGTPIISIPGKDTFLLPETKLAIDSPFTAGIPEIVVAKDAAAKDHNPQSFSFFGKLQGLKHGNIGSVIEDRSGNIWFGTYGGGVSKYDGKSFTHFTDKEGLCNNVVLSVLEDKAGDLWFGTTEGISKYDGKSFTTFTEKAGLINNFVWSIFQDASGNIWFGTNKGVSKYDPGKNGTGGKTFTNFSEKQGLSKGGVRCILQDRSGNIWFGTNGGGVNKYDGRSFTHFTEKEGLSNNIVRSILEDRSGNIWFGTYGGVNKYDGRSFTHFTEKEGLKHNGVLSILEDKFGNLWFATNGGGLNKYDGRSFAHFTETEGLSNNIVLSLLQDRSGNFWLSTYDGLCKYDGKSFTHFTEKEGISNNVVLSILQDRSGNMWFGTNGGGVNKYDGKTITRFTEKEGLSNNTVLSILEDKIGNIWFATNSGGVSKYDRKTFTHFTTENGLSNNDVRNILEDRSGNIWFATHGGGVNKYDGKSFTQFTVKEGLCNNDVRKIVEDRSGDLWFATYGGGVSKYNGKTFTNFNEKGGLISNFVWNVLQDRSGNIWFGTNNGVSKYDGKFFVNFTEKEGLANNAVLSMLEDRSGNIWFGTRFGISKLTSVKLAGITAKIKSGSVIESDVYFKNYNYEDGFLGMGCNGNSICEDKEGTIWIGANDRLTAYHPEGEVFNSIAPNIQITNIELFNENISWLNLFQKKDTVLLLGNGVPISDCKFDGLTKWYHLPMNLSLAYNNNYLTFNFTGITQKQSKKVRYKYKLEGIDNNWSAITTRNEAPYGNLQSGTYTFKVKAINSEGNWSNESEYTFTIRPPWWNTWWFRILVGLLMVSLIIYYIKWRERSLKERQKELEGEVSRATFVIKEQKNLVEEKHKEITDSINYAERIQRSFIATKDVLDENLKDHFVLFKPKDVVSGDFYWASKLNNGNFALATADSTGHGVPGAIMSLLNITSLEKAIETLTQPSDILNSTRKTIIERLKKDGSEFGGKDGMDCSLICFDFKNNSFSYSAANNPVWIVRENRIIELDPDKMPVGKHDRDNIPFTQHEIALQKGDVIYTITDGMPDQFGGPQGKKFMHKKLKELLISISSESMEIQKQKLADVLNEWKGDLEQVDDVTLIGVRV